MNLAHLPVGGVPFPLRQRDPGKAESLGEGFPFRRTHGRWLRRPIRNQDKEKGRKGAKTHWLHWERENPVGRMRSVRVGAGQAGISGSGFPVSQSPFPLRSARLGRKMAATARNLTTVSRISRDKRKSMQ